jgi:tripeptidyl-peptidase-2
MTMVRSALVPILPLFAMVLTLPAPAPSTEPSFPATALLPKAETGVDRFLAEHPEYDGRGVIVVIFDSGVDPGAPGLQVTTDGKPKIIDVIDGSGSGDVDTSTRRQLEEGTLDGLSGRRLRPHPDWSCPTGEYHLGLKPAYELFPRGLVTRLKEKRREDWDESHRIAVETANRELADWKDAHPEPAGEDRKWREELEARLERLNALAEDWDDPGPVYDCVVFHDGERWQAAIDTDEDGDFEDETSLTSFRDERRWATFGEEDLLNYVINVYKEGDLLSIVADAGAHGTHVAGIVAAHDPDRPEMNGIAPGAQLVTVKIGDTRLGSTSVGTGDVRGLVVTRQHDADLINMSYGGPTAMPDYGRIDDLRGEIVNDDGVIFVSTAGNSGPALSSVGGPGGTSSATLGIGAAISPPMMAAQYSVRDPYDELQYPWSSRGPVPDGFLGVDFSAPGAAISPVPNWTLRGNALMNGTSMAAPSVCGGIALLLSGMKAEGVPYTPHTVRRALANTARPLPGMTPWDEGAGTVQIDRAWEHLLEHAGRSDGDVRFEISVAAKAGGRGIYLREPFENDRPFLSSVTVDPVFPEEADNRDKVEYETRVLLEPSEPWVEVADAVLLMHGGRSFDVRVDPTGLPPGAHWAEIRGLDARDPRLGPLFRVPITVIRTLPLEVGSEWIYRDTLRFVPGQVERRFLAVPFGATWADLTLRRLDDDTSRRLILHTVQLVEGEAYSSHSFRRWIGFREDAEVVRTIPVVGERTLELAVAQDWRSLGESEFELEVEFHGIVPADERIALDGAGIAVPLDVTAPLRSESLSPSGSLKTLRRPLRPSETEIRALGPERDRLSKERQVYEMIATYDVAVAEKGEFSVVPAMSALPHIEDTYESQLWMIHDANGRRVAVGAGGIDETVSLDEGDYTLRYHVRHDDPAALEAIESVAVLLDRKLDPPISLSFHRDAAAAMEDRDPFGTRRLAAGETARLVIAVPGPDALPEEAKEGDILLGSVTFGESDTSLSGSGRRPGGYPVTMAVPPSPATPEDSDAAEDEAADERSELEKLAEEVRDLKVERLETLTGEENVEAFDALADEILDEWPHHLPVLVAKLRRLDSDEEGEKKDAGAVVKAADRVIDRVDTEELAAHFGVTVDEEDPAARAKHKEMKARRSALREALRRKAGAIHEVARDRAARSADGAIDPEDDHVRAFEIAFDEYDRWVDPDDEERLELALDRERLHGRLGSALAMLDRHIADAEKPERDLYERRIALLEGLGWNHAAESGRRDRLVRFPPGMPPF